ncbi:hypothetical protein [Longimicrobium terrae]|uniref:Uncharacterized protein n=1 Tax=Longimicrobium terrae TaxID=1639882 RepID=A0A841GLV5_9BACT|nr:hypothetical protein [Longimicrobium terrae]MBB4635183.1 hypothetical protein [Longimicrobium terrae]MBB6069577.1 hypothetical protein [Longimicrobium terrae]NNC31620.1 hypothetical protein [Longimicrobium terrae]
MNAYSPLCMDEMAHLYQPGNEGALDAWDRLTGAFHVLLLLHSRRYPRPFASEEYARSAIPEALNVLRGTAFFSRARANACAVARLVAEVADVRNPGASWRADEMIDAMLDEDAALRAYPEPPPVLVTRN